jgi:hypothetical protein
LNYATEANLFSLVSHFHTRLEDWISSWTLTIDQQRSLFKIVSSALVKDGQHSQALRVLTKYFQTFKSESNVSSEVEQLMKTAVVNAVNSPVESFQDRMILLEVSVFILFLFPFALPCLFPFSIFFLVLFLRCVCFFFFFLSRLVFFW